MNEILKSQRLIIRSLENIDKELFFIMMSNPIVMNPIPQDVFNRAESNAKLVELMEDEPKGQKIIWAISELDNSDLIGICGFLQNSDNNPEIAYRFRPEFWGKGYGTEVASALINFGFNTLKYSVIDADASKTNTKSIKILTKLMTKVDEFWNENDKEFDVRYRITKLNQ